MERFERQVDPDGKLSTQERRLRGQHAMRAYMLQLAKRSAVKRRRKPAATD